jgi:hypothetical protein
LDAALCLQVVECATERVRAILSSAQSAVKQSSGAAQSLLQRRVSGAFWLLAKLSALRSLLTAYGMRLQKHTPPPKSAGGSGATVPEWLSLFEFLSCFSFQTDGAAPASASSAPALPGAADGAMSALPSTASLSALEAEVQRTHSKAEQKTASASGSAAPKVGATASEPQLPALRWTLRIHIGVPQPLLRRFAGWLFGSNNLSESLLTTHVVSVLTHLHVARLHLHDTLVGLHLFCIISSSPLICDWVLLWPGSVFPMVCFDTGGCVVPDRD